MHRLKALIVFLFLNLANSPIGLASDSWVKGAPGPSDVVKLMIDSFKDQYIDYLDRHVILADWDQLVFQVYESPYGLGNAAIQSMRIENKKLSDGFSQHLYIYTANKTVGHMELVRRGPDVEAVAADDLLALEIPSPSSESLYQLKFHDLGVELTISGSGDDYDLKYEVHVGTKVGLFSIRQTSGAVSHREYTVFKSDGRKFHFNIYKKSTPGDLWNLELYGDNSDFRLSPETFLAELSKTQWDGGVEYAFQSWIFRFNWVNDELKHNEDHDHKELEDHSSQE